MDQETPQAPSPFVGLLQAIMKHLVQRMPIQPMPGGGVPLSQLRQLGPMDMPGPAAMMGPEARGGLIGLLRWLEKNTDRSFPGRAATEVPLDRLTPNVTRTHVGGQRADQFNPGGPLTTAFPTDTRPTPVLDAMRGRALERMERNGETHTELIETLRRALTGGLE